jgi:uncharacterized protein DUF488/helicase-like protein
MNPHERKRAQEQFRTDKQICVATEAAGEGINLQFCRLMINYDLPWNPTRLEQRLGRIHRIGQERDVHAFNFVASDSEEGQPIVEGRILHRLLEKLDQMRAVLHDRVYDVIGEVLSINDVNLPEMLREAAFDPRRLDNYLDQIEAIDPSRLQQYEQATGIALARANVDFSGFQHANAEAEERRLMPRYVEDHFVKACQTVGLKVEARADGLWRVEHVLADLRSDRLQAVRKIGKPETSYRKITFRKDDLDRDQHLDAVLAGPGHPLYAAVDERLNEMLSNVAGAVGVFMDATADHPYQLHFFDLAIRGQSTKGESHTLYGEVIAVRETLPYERFLDLLRRAAVTAVADVRSAPYSRQFPQYNKEMLSSALRADGILYVFLGQELGGRPTEIRFYCDGIADYEQMSTSPQFKAGLDRVVEGAKKYRIALMCSERDPLNCHRCLLVGRALVNRGIQVSHIVGDGSIVAHAAIEEMLLERSGKGGDDLFTPRSERLANAYREQARKVAYTEPRPDTRGPISAE